MLRDPDLPIFYAHLKGPVCSYFHRQYFTVVYYRVNTNSTEELILEIQKQEVEYYYDIFVKKGTSRNGQARAEGSCEKDHPLYL